MRLEKISITVLKTAVRADFYDLKSKVLFSV